MDADRSTPQPSPTSPSGSGPLTPVEPSDGGRRWAVLLPAVTFLAGALLGGAVIRAGSDDDPDAAASRPPSASPSPSADPDTVLVRVPGPCVQVADRTEEAYALLDRGVLAARDLDAGGLADLVDEVQRLRPQVQELVEQCRSAARDSVVEPAPSA